MSLTDGLNEQQKAAVTAGEGQLLVLAGPGSGKTRVLTHRIAYLIQEQKIPAWRIMAVTFTNKAAREMRERLEKILGEEAHRLMMGTFHATCARILRREAEHLPRYTRDFIIFDTEDQKEAVKQALTDLNLDPKKFPEGKMLSGISAAKNSLITPAEYQAADYVGQVIRKVYGRYQEILVANNAMDFDDLLMNTVHLFRETPLVTQRYREQYRHILIDEFQDTNLTQYDLVHQLVGQNSLFAVGDADQSIYRWRGADVRNLQRFHQDFPEAQQILLEQNYRSTQLILDAAMEIIQHNRNRVHKQLFTNRPGGAKIVVEEAYSDSDEAQKVVKTIQLLLNQGLKGGDVAVMYRTNAQSRALEEAFVRERMAYKLVGATRFYGRREIKDVLAYLRVIYNPADEFSLLRIINIPKRGIGKATIDSLREWARQNGWQPAEALLELATRPGIQHPFAGRAFKPLLELGQQLSQWIGLSRQLSVSQLLEKILEEIDYQNYLDDGTAEGQDRWANVMEFRNVTALAEGLSLSEFLQEVALVSEVDNLQEGENAPTLLTLHAAKGLEFPVVFITGLEDGVLPHSRALGSGDLEDMEEERRLFYVGITRAKDRLYLYHAFQRMIWGRSEMGIPSRFLRDIPAGVVEGGGAHLRKGGLKPAASSWQWGEQKKPTPAAGRSQPSWAKEEEPANRPKVRHSTAVPPVESTRPLPRPNSGAEEEKPARPMGPQTAQFRAGDKVHHAKFGAGLVISSKLTGNDEEVTVAFEGVGIKKLAASIAKLEKLS